MKCDGLTQYSAIMKILFMMACLLDKGQERHCHPKNKLFSLVAILFYKCSIQSILTLLSRNEYLRAFVLFFMAFEKKQ